MKKLIVLFLVCSFIGFLKADDPSDLVIVNPYATPGSEEKVEFLIEFYDITGRKINLEYTVDNLTGKITIKGGTGTVIVSVTNKKTVEKKTQTVVFVSGS